MLDKIIDKTPYTIVLAMALLAPSIAIYSGLALVPVLALSAFAPTLFYITHLTKSIKRHSFQSNYRYIKLLSPFFLFLLYTLISTTWSADVIKSLSLWVRMALLLFLGMSLWHYLKGLKKEQQQKLLHYLFIGTLIAMSFCYLELFSKSWLYRHVKGIELLKYNYSYMNRGATYLALLSWPVFGYLIHRYGLIKASLYLGASIATLLQLDSQAASLSIILGLVACGVIYIAPNLWKRALQIAAFVLILTVPSFLHHLNTEMASATLPDIAGQSQKHRLKIWSFAANKAAEKPFFGWGFDGSRHIPVKEEDMLWELKVRQTVQAPYFPAHPLPLHPHNYEMQLWLEIGAVGVLLFAIVVASIIGAIPRTFRNGIDQAVAVGMLTTYMAIGQIGYGIWQNWWVAALCLSIVYLRLLPKAAKHSS